MIVIICKMIEVPNILTCFQLIINILAKRFFSIAMRETIPLILIIAINFAIS
jgi:hypothetical protein